MTVEKDYNVINWSSILKYDETSPSGLRWTVSPAYHVKEGSVAGSNCATCWEVRYKRQTWLAHRIIWILKYGYINPELCINHINCDPHDNRISNLELCTITENNQRASPVILGTVTATNTSGFNGVNLLVCFNRDKTREYRYYVAAANKDGKLVRELFSINKLGEAEALRLALERRKQMENEWYH